MKRKIGEIYNKPIIEGDINLKTPNEIHKSELSGGRNTSKIYYYKIDNDALIQEFESMNLPEDSIIQVLPFLTYPAQGYIYNDSGDDIRGIYYSMGRPIIDSMWDASRVCALLVCEDVYYGDYPYVIKGDLYTKVNYTIEVASVEDPSYAEELKPLIATMLKHTTEITKEEFWNMCKLPITALPTQ